MSEKHTGTCSQPGTVILLFFVLFYFSNINNNKTCLINHFHTSIVWESQCEALENVHFCYDHVFVEVVHLSYFRYSTCHPFTWYVQLVPHPLPPQGESLCWCVSVVSSPFSFSVLVCVCGVFPILFQCVCMWHVSGCLSACLWHVSQALLCFCVIWL